MSRTVRVRIAVAVDDSGEWNACGWSGASDERDMMGIACDTVGDGEARFWVEAELPVPEPRVVAADVFPA